MYKQLKKICRWFSRKQVLLIVLIFSVALLGLTVYRFAAQNSWLEDEFASQVKSMELNNELSELSLHIKIAETADLDYAISGNKKFGENFEFTIDSARSIYRHIQLLENRKDDVTDAGLFSKSDSLVQQKIAFMQRIKSLCDNNKRNEALALIGTSEALILSSAITKINTQTGNDIKLQLKKSQEGFLKVNDKNNNLAYVGLAASILLITMVFYFLLIEIRRTKKISEELKVKKELYKVTINSLNEALISTDKEGRVIYINPAAEILTGWRLQEALQQPLHTVFNVVNEETGKPFENIVTRILREGKTIGLENNTILKAKGSGTFIISNSGNPILDANGDISGAVLVFNDITEKDKIAKKVKENEKQYRDLIENLPEAVYTCDEEGYIKLFNKAAIELWGREPIAGKDLWCGSWKIFNTDGTELRPGSCQMAITLKEQRPVHGAEIIIQRPDESFRHVLPYPSPVFNAEGQLTGAINMLIDVTDKKEREVLTGKTEEKYQKLIEQASDGILIYSFDGTIHEFNKSCYTLLGYTREEFAGLKLNDILVGEIVVNQQNYEAILAGETKTLYRNLMCKDGSFIETEVTVKMLADGKVIAFARDITERKRAEEIIKKEKELSDSVISSLPGVFYFYDENLKLLRWNKQFENVTGYSAAEITSMNPVEFFESEDREYMQERSRKVFASGSGDAEANFTTKNGKKIPFYFTGLRMQYEGKPALLGIGIDITERKKAELVTRKAIERYDILARATSDTIWDWDIVNNKMQYNDGITKMFGYETSSVKNIIDWWNDKLHSDDFKKVALLLEDIFEKGLQRFQLTYRFRCSNGSYKHIFDRAFVLFDENGKPTRMIGAMQDITYQVEEEMRTAKAIIDAQEQERRFIGEELHDNVNQILVGSLLNLGMVKEMHSDAEKAFEFITTTKGYISSAIDEIRKLSHQLAPAKFDDISLKDIFENLLFDINLDNRFTVNLHFDKLNEKNIPEDVQINLFRILQEQTKNILKYAEACTIEIAVTLSADTVSLRIFDDGKGFDTTISRNGIGLGNIKKRAESLSGKFMLNSAPGKGCEIIVEIPVGV